MLSILIPTYNYVCAHLVCDLQKQCEEAQALLGREFEYEIIVADDGSTDGESLEKNAVVEYLPHCRLVESKQNVGRAAIRNLLLRESQGDWMLIIDADAEVISDNFVLRYVEAVQSNSENDIVIGGLKNPPSAPADCSLRFRYEESCESIRSLETRRENPTMYFSTFNFMASRRVFERINFDERCTEYGYEDALFGIEAERCGFNILHIDNPLQHNGINDNASFLRNSEAALRTLRRLGPPMTDRARVACAARHFEGSPLRFFTLRPLLILLYKMSRPLLRRNLISRHPNLKIFAFYKLGYYLSFTRK